MAPSPARVTPRSRGASRTPAVPLRPRQTAAVGPATYLQVLSSQQVHACPGPMLPRTQRLVGTRLCPRPTGPASRRRRADSVASGHPVGGVLLLVLCLRRAWRCWRCGDRSYSIRRFGVQRAFLDDPLLSHDPGPNDLLFGATPYLLVHLAEFRLEFSLAFGPFFQDIPPRFSCCRRCLCIPLLGFGRIRRLPMRIRLSLVRNAYPVGYNRGSTQGKARNGMIRRASPRSLTEWD